MAPSLLQIAGNKEGKIVDTECYKLTASFVREKHKGDRSVPVCQFFEVVPTNHQLSSLLYSTLHTHTHTYTHTHSLSLSPLSLSFSLCNWCVFCRNLTLKGELSHYLLEYMTW